MAVVARGEELLFDFPLPRTHTGIALGNGATGCLVWGDERLHLTLNHIAFWDHRGGELLIEGTTYQRLKAAYDPADQRALERAFIRRPRPEGTLRSMRLPFGRFELSFRDGLRPRQGRLHWPTGRLRIGVGQGEVELALLPDADALIIEDPGNLVTEVRHKSCWDQVGEQLAEYRFEPPLEVSEDGLTGCALGCPEDDALGAACRRGEGRLAVALALAPNAAEALAAAGEVAAGVLADGEALARHDAWWRGYWERCPEVDLPSEFLTTFYRYALFKFGAATNPHSPLPAGLQGPWIEEYQLAPWSGDYHFNVNIQQIYTLGFATGNTDHFLPLFDMIDGFKKVLAHNARVLHGIDDGLTCIHAVDDRGYACGGISAGSSIDHAVTGWMAQLYWLYYQHTLDIDFLRERAWPFMAGTMRVYEAMLEERDGRLSIPISISAEYAQPLPDGRRQNVGRDPSYQLACCHMLAEALLEAARLLGLPASPRWLEIRERLPAYTLVGDPGEERIGIWAGQDLAICHRHHSHLGAIYPFDTLPEGDAQVDAIVDNSLDQWILRGMGQWSEWCIPWAAILQARLGLTESPRVLLELWREVFINEGLATAYLPRFRGLTAHRRADLLKPKETHEIMQLDGTMAGATAVLEMLIHTRRGVTRIFPAVSEQWPDAGFRGVRVPGAFIVSAARRGGRTAWVEVESAQGGELALAVPDRPTMRLRREGGEQVVSLPARLALAAGERLVLTAD